MSWLPGWGRKGADDSSPATARHLVGLDLNSTRARAVVGGQDRQLRRLVLDDPSDELPLVLSLEGKSVQVGRPGLAVSRRLPLACCADFLAGLGLNREWKAGRHRLDAAVAVGLVMDKLRPVGKEASALALALPPYLSSMQVRQLAGLAERVRLPLIASFVTPLALAAALEPPHHQRVLVLDADAHALTGTMLVADGTKAQVAGNLALPQLNLLAWKERLLHALADRCILLCRRDPRVSAEAEQRLYEQIDDAMDRAAHGQQADVLVEMNAWHQKLPMRPDDFEAFCGDLARQAVAGLRDLWTPPAGGGTPPDAVWMTDLAGRLPGLASALRPYLPERTAMKVFPPDAAAHAAVVLCHRVEKGELPRLHVDTVVNLPPETPPARGGHAPAREAGHGTSTAFTRN